MLSWLLKRGVVFCMDAKKNIDSLKTFETVTMIWGVNVLIISCWFVLIFGFNIFGILPKVDIWQSYLRLSSMIVILGFFLYSIMELFAGITGKRSQWWQIGGHDPSWNDILRMTIGGDKPDEMQYDPLVYTNRNLSIIEWFQFFFGGVLVLSLTVFLWISVYDGKIISKFLSDVRVNDPAIPDTMADYHTVNLALSGNLTAFLALIAALASIYFTYRQLQAKIKADSRQAWLDKLRDNISRFIALADAIHYNQCGKEPEKARQKMTAARMKMELMLNPSEKDLRLLMFLSIKLVFFEFGEEEFQMVQDVNNVRKDIKRQQGYKEKDWSPIIGAIPPKWRHSEYEREYSDLIGYLLRLSHVVLKREWERVKRTR